jgi:Flp pilus assembly protein TadB
VVSVLVAIILIGGGIWYLYQYMEKKRVKREVAEIGDLPAVPMGDADHIYCY